MFDAFVLKSVPEGESDEERYVIRRGKRIKQFNFSGSLKHLPLLYIRLKTLLSSIEPLPMPQLENLLKLQPGPHDIIDISDFAQPTHTNDILGFEEFRIFARDNVFKRPGDTGKVAKFHSFFITKLKSERAKKKSRPGTKDYFEFSCSVR